MIHGDQPQRPCAYVLNNWVLTMRTPTCTSHATSQYRTMDWIKTADKMTSVRLQLIPQSPCGRKVHHPAYALMQGQAPCIDSAESSINSQIYEANAHQEPCSVEAWINSDGAGRNGKFNARNRCNGDYA